MEGNFCVVLKLMLIIKLKYNVICKLKFKCFFVRNYILKYENFGLWRIYLKLLWVLIYILYMYVFIFIGFGKLGFLGL